MAPRRACRAPTAQPPAPPPAMAAPRRSGDSGGGEANLAPSPARPAPPQVIAAVAEEERRTAPSPARPNPAQPRRRLPLFFWDDALCLVPLDWYNLRLHLYSGNKNVTSRQSNVRLRGHKQPIQNVTIALDDPIPWFDSEPETFTSKGKEKPKLI